MATTALRANQIFGYSSYPKAFLNNLIPSSNRPNTTGDFILEGAFFTQNMTVVIQGQTINRITFESDNKVIVNVTTGPTEGTFDIILNNGTGAVTFTGAIFIVVGDVFEPATADWTKTNPVNVIKNGVFSTVYGSQGSAVWNNKQLNFTKDFSVRFNFKFSPLGNAQSGAANAEFLELLRVSDSVPLFKMRVGYASTLLYFGSYSIANGWLDAQNLNKAANPQALNYTPVYRLDFISGNMILYQNGTVKRTFTDVVSENLKIKINVKYFDIVDVKYIELV